MDPASLATATLGMGSGDHGVRDVTERTCARRLTKHKSKLRHHFQWKSFHLSLAVMVVEALL